MINERFSCSPSATSPSSHHSSSLSPSSPPITVTAKQNHKNMPSSQTNKRPRTPTLLQTSASLSQSSTSPVINSAENSLDLSTAAHHNHSLSPTSQLSLSSHQPTSLHFANSPQPTSLSSPSAATTTATASTDQIHCSKHDSCSPKNFLAYREHVLRKGIFYIQAQQHMTANQKTHNIQKLMSTKKWIPTYDSTTDLTSIITKVVDSESAVASPPHYIADKLHESDIESLNIGKDSHPASPTSVHPASNSSSTAIPSATAADSLPSYTDASQNQFGCPHYARSCKVFASCCQTWTCCQICHDSTATHSMNRKNVQFVLCMECSTVQAPSQRCIQCNSTFGHYYCSDCKLWENNGQKQIFHCADCGICRLGNADTFQHCSRCNCCLTNGYFNSHKCIERSLECDCPICGDYLFTSTHPVMFMLCGHAIHTGCFCKMEMRSSHQCPICQKSVRDMRWLYERLDEVLAVQQMPEEYANDRSLILCNDCEKRSETKYHFLYHKCQQCSSYNTKVIETMKC